MTDGIDIATAITYSGQHNVLFSKRHSKRCSLRM